MNNQTLAQNGHHTFDSLLKTLSLCTARCTTLTHLSHKQFDLFRRKMDCMGATWDKKYAIVNQ
jgi:hypothetical protein